MLRWRHLFLLVWIGVPVLTHASNLTMDDFAYGLKIDVPAGAAVAVLDLPEDVYRRTWRTDLGDLRVFNASGEPVPHVIRFARSQAAEAPWRPLSFFPIPADVKSDAHDYGLHVQTGPDGTIVRITPPRRPAAASASGRTILVDLSQIDIDWVELRLEWEPGALNRMAIFSIEASDDLVHWRNLQSRAVISDIHYGGQRLKKNTIGLLPSRQRYLRLRQVDDGPAVALAAIQGRSRPEGRSAVRALLAIPGQRSTDTPGEVEYDTGGAFPVDRVNLVFDQPNSMAEARLDSRPTRQGAWRRRCEGMFYRIDIDGASLTGAPQPVGVSMDRYWRLSMNDSESTIGRAIPRLEIGYRPHDLYFIARGSGPFTLAFGSTGVEPLNTNVGALVDSIGQDQPSGIERWVHPQGMVFELGGARRLAPPPKPVPTRRVVLWSILLAGVLIVAAMAWRLARRLKP